MPLPRCLRTTIPVDQRSHLASPAGHGIRLITVTAGMVRTYRSTSQGPRTVLLTRGDVARTPAAAQSGEWENVGEGDAVMVDTTISAEWALACVLGVAAPGATALTAPTGPDALEVSTDPAVASVLDALAEPARPRNDPDRHVAMRYLAEHLLRPPSARVPVTPCATTVTADAGVSEPDCRPFDAEQQRALLVAMRARLADRVRIDELAAVVGYSRYHFLRRFNATFARTPYQYLIDLRILTARRRLENGHYDSLGSVAAQCGFTRTESFIRAFRRRTGTTPARYAAASRTGSSRAPRADCGPGA